MALQFIDICALLEALEKLAKRTVPLLSKPDREREAYLIVEQWFMQHRGSLDAPSANGVAILSTLLPERRTDRMYGLKETRLSLLFSRCLCLSAEDARRVEQYRQPGHGDLGECLAKVLKLHDDSRRPSQSVTVDEVDSTLHAVASRNRFSSPAVRRGTADSSPYEMFTPLLVRMRSHEVKWLVRLILKDFTPVTLDCNHIIRAYHFLLPGLLRFQDSFEAATAMLKGPLVRYNTQTEPTRQAEFKIEAASLIRPKIGVMVGRPTFHKARSIDQCLKLINKKRWSVERKYDGEFCQIHVNLRNVAQPIQIFSKSGKDSTEDRRGILPALNECLGLGTKASKFERQCILLGELVVYCEQTQDILPFHKIRQHVTRSGRFLGTTQDSPPKAYEHLMIIFFDILLLDDDVLLTKPHAERRAVLSRVIKKRAGHAMTSEHGTINFAEEGTARSLVCQFAAAIALRREGLILKPADAPYFSLLDDEPGTWHSGFIKLKKDYMQALGEDRDVADLAVIGASYNARRSVHCSTGALQYTTFHLGCITNQDSLRFGKMPVFRIVGTIDAAACVPGAELEALNKVVRFDSRPFERHADRLADADQFDITLQGEVGLKIDLILNSPPVVEVLGSGFEKPSNKGFYMLRHARILKMHLDRAWQDATTLDYLQQMAEASLEAPPEGDSQETLALIEKWEQRLLKRVEAGKLSDGITPRSASSTKSLVSPRSPLAHRQDGGNAASSPTANAMARAEKQGKPASRSAPASTPIDKAIVEVTTPFEILEDEGAPAIVDQESGLATPPISSGVDAENQPPNVETNLVEQEPPAQSKKRPASCTATPPARKRARHVEEEVKRSAEKEADSGGASSPMNRFRCPAGIECQWAHRAFLLSPCVKDMPLLTEDLIPAHGGVLSKAGEQDSTAKQLDPAVRLDRPHEPHVVLVEPLRPRACRRVAEGLLKENWPGEFEFWDWRVMQTACGGCHGEGGPVSVGVSPGESTRARGYLWGRSWWCESRQARQLQCYYR